MSGSDLRKNYSYDAAGNLLTKGNKTFTYNTANQITNSGFTYDANGNLTRDGNFIYTYNALNQLVQVNRASNGSLVTTYTYNHNGLRKSKTVNGVTTNYNWDASGNLIRESTPSGNTYYYYSTSGELVGLIKNNQTYITHNNLRGDIVSITDTGGNIYAQYHFDPWGNQISYSGSLSQPFRYAGYYYDDETGLYYLKSRYYSPALGRFLTKDDIDYIDINYPDTLNGYTYAYDSPTNFVDPDGTFALVLGDPKSAALVTGVTALAAAAAAATAELAKDVKDTWDRYWSSFNPEKYPWNELPHSGSKPYNPPVDKSGKSVYKKGEEEGAIDKDGNEWKWDKGARKVGNPHWDVQHPDGTHTNVNPKSGGRPGEINHGTDNYPKK